VVNRKRLEKWRKCSSTPVGLGKGFFLGKNIVTPLDHSPYSSYLGAADFYIFPQLKSSFKGLRFSDASDITDNATEEVKRLS
jgi:hypothetical protein